MKTIQAIQYLERFENEHDAKCASVALSRLDGCLKSRFYRKESFPRCGKDWVVQALFEFEDGINPECLTEHYGFRLVVVPLSFLASK